MEGIFGLLMLLGCGTVIFCAGAFNWEWFLRGAHSPLSLVFPHVVVRGFFALFGFAVMIFAMMLMLGFELPPPPQ